MTDLPANLNLEDVLDAFSMEETNEKPTLDRYLSAYPQFAGELIDLSRELARAVPASLPPLSATDRATIDAAWSKHMAARPAPVVDPFAALSPTRSREIAILLGVPRQVVTSFRERRILPASVPSAFARRFAKALAVPLEGFMAWISLPQGDGLARSHFAEGKPGGIPQVTLERVLVDAGVAGEDIKRLLATED